MSPKQPRGMEYSLYGLDIENVAEWKERLTRRVKQMMFVSGETAEPSADTTGMIEEIVRQQVIEMVSPADTRYLSPYETPLTIPSLFSALLKPAAVAPARSLPTT
jgi:Transcription initiation factor IID, 18kD subunit